MTYVDVFPERDRVTIAATHDGDAYRETITLPVSLLDDLRDRLMRVEARNPDQMELL